MCVCVCVLFSAGRFEPCSPSDAGAQEASLQYYADNNLADKVTPPAISMRDFEKVPWGGSRTLGPGCVLLGCVLLGCVLLGCVLLEGVLLKYILRQECSKGG